MATVGKGPHFLQKNATTELSGYRPVDSDNQGSTVYANTTSTICLRQKFFTNAVADLEGVSRVPWNPPFGSVVIESYGSLAFSKTQLFRL